MVDGGEAGAIVVVLVVLLGTIFYSTMLRLEWLEVGGGRGGDGVLPHPSSLPSARRLQRGRVTTYHVLFSSPSPLCSSVCAPLSISSASISSTSLQQDNSILNKGKVV
jgi:hypothetical protein